MDNFFEDYVFGEPAANWAKKPATAAKECKDANIRLRVTEADFSETISGGKAKVGPYMHLSCVISIGV